MNDGDHSSGGAYPVEYPLDYSFLSHCCNVAIDIAVCKFETAYSVPMRGIGGIPNIWYLGLSALQLHEVARVVFTFK